MAANDYYNQFDAPHKRTDAPLPPAPHNQSQQSISPVTSPFDDQHRYEYPSTHNLTHSMTPQSAYNDTTYHGASSRPHDSPYDTSRPGVQDPFADKNAVPLNAYGKMDGSPTRYQADPEGRMYAAPQRQKKGWFSGRVTWVCYILTIVQCGVFIGEIIKNGILTGSPIEIKPQFNIMIGPSPYVLINMGARYPPCMHTIKGVTDADITQPISWPCPNTTKSDTECSLSELCGMGGVPVQPAGIKWNDRSHEPNQWWRFIVPIFLHAGIIHLGFNMLLQMTLGRDMEKEIGPLRFALVYFSAGIFGFVLGGNYAAQTIPSVGASGSLFGILALVLLDLLYNWGSRRSPVKDLLFLLLDFAIAFVLGLLPGLDNFSHIGGFLMGIALGICLLHSPQKLRDRIGVAEPPYATVDTHEPVMSGGLASAAPGLQKFVKQPVGFFKGRKPFWWAWWLIRAGALVAVFIGFILLLKNFYEWRNTCSWCKHLSCLPVKNWCDIGNFDLKNQTSGNNTDGNQRRDLAPISLAMYAAEEIFRR